jgi:molybdenum cofactor cytidylyltransferase
MSDVVGLLLAAGASRRFGSDKRQHRLPDGTPMVLAAARRLLAACPLSITVVRPGDDELAAMLAEAGLRVTECADAAFGMGHSLAAGVAATFSATPDAGCWLVALADMPAIAPESYAAVLAALHGGAPLARPTHNGHPGHPVGFAVRFRDDLLALRGDQGGKAIIDAHRDLLTLCPVNDPGVLIDIDTPPVPDASA